MSGNKNIDAHKPGNILQILKIIMNLSQNIMIKEGRIMVIMIMEKEIMVIMIMEKVKNIILKKDMGRIMVMKVEQTLWLK